MHSQLLAAHGGFRLAAAYAHSLCSNHAFVDGNKRIAFLASTIFLQINGFTFIADEAIITVVFQKLASGDVDLIRKTTS